MEYTIEITVSGSLTTFPTTASTINDRQAIRQARQLIARHGAESARILVGGKAILSCTATDWTVL